VHSPATETEEIEGLVKGQERRERKRLGEKRACKLLGMKSGGV
jgi:hypothetical protein